MKTQKFTYFIDQMIPVAGKVIMRHRHVAALIYRNRVVAIGSNYPYSLHRTKKVDPC
jgi:hypothetical protein